jgi:hypothetical protein
MAASVIRPLESAPRRNAPLADVARMAAALARPRDLQRLPELRRLLELEVTLQRGLGRER